jgi:phosphoglycolate phosphatase
MRDYQVYMLDFDGTLFDTLDSLVGCYQIGFRAIGLDCTKEQVSFYMHMSLSETCDYLKIFDENRRKTCADTIMGAIDRPDFVKLIHIYDDVIPTLNELKKRKKTIAIVSGNTERHIRLVLDQFGIGQYFSFIVGSSPDRRPKPFADPVLFALKKIPTIRLSDVVYVGDSLQDPQTAINGGVDGILLERRGEYPDYRGVKIPTLSDFFK